jgi:hypothetical protein
MATSTGQVVYLDTALRPYAEAIFGTLSHGTGFQWNVGDTHPNDRLGSNSKAINDSLNMAGASGKVVVVIDS